jgi:hypothetical protein
MRSILGDSNSAGVPDEEILDLTEELAAPGAEDEEVLDLTEEFLQGQTQPDPAQASLEPEAESPGQAGVSANIARNSSTATTAEDSLRYPRLKLTKLATSSGRLLML